MGKENGIVCKALEVFPFCSQAYRTSYLQLLRVMQPSKCHKVFAWLPFGNQLFWFRETFLQIKLPAPKFYVPSWKMVPTWRVVTRRMGMQ